LIGSSVQKVANANKSNDRSNTSRKSRNNSITINGNSYSSTSTTSTTTTNDSNLPPLPSKVPRHIAVIMDGNRRYARNIIRSDPIQGHWAGGQTLIDFCQWCIQDGIEMITVYAFSTENWNRDEKEVTALMSIFAKYAETFRVEALNRNVKVNVLSTDLDRMPLQVKESIKGLQDATMNCTGFTVNICLSYGSRAEIVQACKNIAIKHKEGVIDANDLNEETISNYMITKSLPDPEILIRTSGEYRISNFLLWQLAYTEMFFVDKYWPELNHNDLRIILNQFSNRCRRYGI
jgi:undecaprenyl diphosphate synthase